MTIKGCPVCMNQPEINLQKPWEVELSCPAHGYHAEGRDLDQAVEHWNVFVTWVANGGLKVRA